MNRRELVVSMLAGTPLAEVAMRGSMRKTDQESTVWAAINLLHSYPSGTELIASYEKLRAMGWTILDTVFKCQSLSQCLVRKDLPLAGARAFELDVLSGKSELSEPFGIFQWWTQVHE